MLYAAYPNSLGTKGYVVVVVAHANIMTSILTSGTAWSVQADTPDTDSKPPGGSKENHVSSGPNGTGETGQPIPRKRQSRGNRKAQSSRKQRFFAGNFISNPDQYGGVSESPPGNSVGYFYGSTPENHR